MTPGTGTGFCKDFVGLVRTVVVALRWILEKPWTGRFRLTLAVSTRWIFAPHHGTLSVPLHLAGDGTARPWQTMTASFKLDPKKCSTIAERQCSYQAPERGPTVLAPLPAWPTPSLLHPVDKTQPYLLFAARWKRFINANDPERIRWGMDVVGRSSAPTLSPARNCKMRGYLLSWLWWSGRMTTMVDLLVGLVE